MFTPIFIKHPNNLDLINLSCYSIIERRTDSIGEYIKLNSGFKVNSCIILRFENTEERDNFYFRIKNLVCNNI